MNHPPICFEDRPVCIFSTGPRTGSTLLRTVLNSHPDLRMWGEHGGALQQLLQMHLVLQDAVQPRPWGRFDLPALGASHNAQRAFLHTFFGAPALAEGKPRWGFKETKYGREIADRLLELYPAVSIVHLTRHPIDALISMKRREEAPESWDRARTLRGVGNWERINRGFLNGPHPRVLLLKYEDMMADREATITRLADFAGFDPAGVQRSAFDLRVSLEAGSSFESRRPIPRSSLDAEERALLTTPGMREACDRLGYELTFAP